MTNDQRAKKNVLVFPCGSEIGAEIFRSLRYSKDFHLIGGSSVDDHGRFIFKDYLGDIPQVTDEIFVEKINQIVKERNIDFIFPAHDSVVLKLAQHQDEIDAVVVTSPVETCEIARSKAKTYAALEGSVTIPKAYARDSQPAFPVFLKPEVGQGSRGVSIAHNSQQIQSALEKDPTLLILEYLPGPEYTVDCFTDRHGKLVFCQGRSRDRIVNGVSVNSKPVNDPAIQGIAENINRQLKFRGVWFFQLKENSSGEYALLEIAPRVAGTMALSRIIGANLPLLSLYDRMDVDVSLAINNFSAEIDRSFCSSYKLGIDYDQVFVDFDDTIIVDGKVNELIIAFIYKSINEGKKIIMITKHIHEISETLNRHHIAINLFDDIISLSKLEDKSLHIADKAIFIDDSFAERKSVHEKIGIPVFDVSEAVELL